MGEHLNLLPRTSHQEGKCASRGPAEEGLFHRVLLGSLVAHLALLAIFMLQPAASQEVESMFLDEVEMHRWIRLEVLPPVAPAPPTPVPVPASRVFSPVQEPALAPAEDSPEPDEPPPVEPPPVELPSKQETRKAPGPDLPPSPLETPSPPATPLATEESDAGLESDKISAPVLAPEPVHAEKVEKVERAATPGEDRGALRSAYLNQLVPNVRGQYFYPQMGRRLGLEGRVLVALEINADGEVVTVTLHRSSGHDELDRAALTALRRLPRLPAPPPGLLEKGRVRVIVPMIYKLNGGH